MGHERLPADIEIIDEGFVAPEQFKTDRPQDECGVYGIWAPGQPVLSTVYRALRKLEHRGQSGAGIAFYDSSEQRLTNYTGMGKVPVAIPLAKPAEDGSTPFDHAQTPVVLGHTRYSTANSDRASQPFVKRGFGIALAHNGHIEDIEQVAQSYGVDTREAASDSDVLARLIDERAQILGSAEAAVRDVTPHLEGAYSLVITDGSQLIGVRDPWGFRPLVLGELQHDPGKFVLASEETAFLGANAAFVRDIEPGEIISIGEHGIQNSYIDRQEDTKECMFEYIYLAKPWETVNGVVVHEARKNMGRYLAQDSPAEADIVVAVPNSGRSAASGYAQEAGLNNEEGIFVEDGIGRTFILREGVRETMLEDKHIPNPSALEGQRIVLVDDSVIKGNTMKNLVAKLRNVGAREIHVRSAAPPYVNACYMGMDTRDVSRLVARGRANEEIAEHIGADSIAFNSVARVHQAINEARKGEPVGICDACATGNYPFRNGTFAKLSQLAVARTGES